MDKQYQDLSLVAGANLRSLIKESKYRTQENFAFEFGVDVRSVGRWINQGINDMSTIMQIARFFDVDPLTILQ